MSHWQGPYFYSSVFSQSGGMILEFLKSLLIDYVISFKSENEHLF